MMQRGVSRSKMVRMGWVVALVLMVCVVCVSCGGPEGGNTTSSGPGASQTTAENSKPGAQPCPVVVSQAAHWDPVVPTQAGINKVERVTCANLMGSSTLQALVSVRNSDGQSRGLDIYVYTDIIKPAPKKVFELRNLYQGDVQISNYNSLLFAEVNVALTENTDETDRNVEPDLYREFIWSEHAGTLVQVAFPGIYPLTRYQAWQTQQEVNQGKSTEWLDAKMVASRLISNQNLLDWSAEPQITRGGGPKDTEAEAVVTNPTGDEKVKMTLQRLEGNTTNGIWVVTSMVTEGLEITSPKNLDHIQRSVTVTGKGSSFEGQTGSVRLLDHAYEQAGNDARAEAPLGNAPFTSTLEHSSPFKKGKQEGLVALFVMSSVDGANAGLTVVKVLL